MCIKFIIVSHFRNVYVCTYHQRVQQVLLPPFLTQFRFSYNFLSLILCTLRQWHASYLALFCGFFCQRCSCLVSHHVFITAQCSRMCVCVPLFFPVVSLISRPSTNERKSIDDHLGLHYTYTEPIQWLSLALSSLFPFDCSIIWFHHKIIIIIIMVSYLIVCAAAKRTQLGIRQAAPHDQIDC